MEEHNLHLVVFQFELYDQNKITVSNFTFLIDQQIDTILRYDFFTAKTAALAATGLR